MKKAKKSKAKSVPKLGIYVPEHRAADVDDYRDRMNFSAIFWSSFDREKHRLDCIPKGKAMSTVVQRLSQSKLAHEQTQVSSGREDGAAWAAKHAEYIELVKLQEYQDLALREHVIDVTAYAISELFPDIDFWECALGEDHDTVSDAFAEAFVEGAVDVLENAEDEGL